MKPNQMNTVDNWYEPLYEDELIGSQTSSVSELRNSKDNWVSFGAALNSSRQTEGKEASACV